nr:MAG TPA: hypothetical protein [Bacteriophage sp.]
MILINKWSYEKSVLYFISSMVLCTLLVFIYNCLIR